MTHDYVMILACVGRCWHQRDNTPQSVDSWHPPYTRCRGVDCAWQTSVALIAASQIRKG